MKTIQTLAALIVMWGGASSASAAVYATWTGAGGAFNPDNQPAYLSGTGGILRSDQTLAGESENAVMGVTLARSGGLAGDHFDTGTSNPLFAFAVTAGSALDQLKFSILYGGGLPGLEIKLMTLLTVNEGPFILADDFDFTLASGDSSVIDGSMEWTYDLTPLQVAEGDELVLWLSVIDDVQAFEFEFSPIGPYMTIGSMSLQIIPEPSAALLVGLGFASLLVRKRR